MTSNRKNQTNRVNARRSTGPKTRHGRIRSAKNAFRHGLSLPMQCDPALCEAVQILAGQIAGPQPSALKTPAVQVAEAQVDLCRVRAARHQLLCRQLADSHSATLEEKLTAILSDEDKNLLAIDRYERRALSRRKFAIRAFDAASPRLLRTQNRAQTVHG